MSTQNDNSCRRPPVDSATFSNSNRRAVSTHFERLSPRTMFIEICFKSGFLPYIGTHPSLLRIFGPSRRFNRNLLFIQSSALNLDYAFAQKIYCLRAMFTKLSFSSKFQLSIGILPPAPTKTCANSLPDNQVFRVAFSTTYLIHRLKFCTYDKKILSFRNVNPHLNFL